jgi:GNAT superfamily N-acetyltransferase
MPPALHLPEIKTNVRIYGIDQVRLDAPFAAPAERPWIAPPIAARQPIRLPIRMLEPGERSLLRAHLLRLPPADRRRRFLRDIDDDVISRYVAGIDFARAAVAAYIEEGMVRAASQLAWPDIPWLEGEAELAVEVEPRWQRRGIGTAMVARAAEEARERRLPGIRFYAGGANEPVRRIAHRFEARLTTGDGEIEGRIAL